MELYAFGGRLDERMGTTDMDSTVRYLRCVSFGDVYYARRMAPGSLGLGKLGHLGRNPVWSDYCSGWFPGYSTGYAGAFSKERKR